MNIVEMMRKLGEFAKKEEFSENFLISEFGKDGFNYLKERQLIRRASKASVAQYIEELQHISPQNLAAFRKLIRGENPQPELLTSVSAKAEPLPLVYYPKGETCISCFSFTIDNIRELKQNPCYITTSDPRFDNVLGYELEKGLTVTRYSGVGYYPRNCHVIAEKFGGRIPDTEEMLKIITNLDRVNQTALSIDEDTLYKGYYLVREKMSASAFTVINIENPDDCRQIKYNETCCFVAVK